MKRMVEYWVNSVTGVNNRLMMAVMEMMVADAHVDRVWMDNGDIVMEKMIQLMVKRSRMKRVVMMRYWHYGGRRGWGQMARDEEINVLNLSCSLGSGHSIGSEGDHGVSEGVGGECLAGQQ